MPPTITISYNPATDSDEAIEMIERLRRQPVEQRAAVAPASDAVGNDAMTLYNTMDPHNLTRIYLESLDTERRPFSDFAEILGRGDGHLDTPAIRAVHRNAKRTEKWLIEHGRISGPVIQVDSSRYDAEGGNRYYLDPGAKAGLDTHLGR